MIKEENEIKVTAQPTNMAMIMQYVKYFLELLDYILLQQIDPIKIANYFGVVFDKTPTYTDVLF